VTLSTLSANLNGTRASHTLVASAKGAVQGQAVDFNLAAAGKLTDARAGTRWDGTISQLENRGIPAIRLDAPLAVGVAAGRLTLGATRLTLEGAALDLKSLVYDHGSVSSQGSLTGVDVARMLQVHERLTHQPAPVKTDLIFDGDWNVSLARSATGYVQVRRRSGDVTADVGRGIAALGLGEVSVRADFSGGNRLNVTAQAQAARLGTLAADLHMPLALRDGVLTVVQEAPLAGAVSANIPSLRTTGGLLGPTYILGGQLALKLAVGGQLARPTITGELNGDELSATLVDQGITLKDGIVRIALAENLVEFKQVEFHGASGTLKAVGKVNLDAADADLSASIVADKLELFASPDRRLSLSGSATVANAGVQRGMAISGKFRVDHALFDLPEQSAPHLGDDVVIVRPDGTMQGETTRTAADVSEKPVGRFAPRADIEIDLGEDFRFRGVGADLRLRGLITALAAPDEPLRAVGNVRVVEGSTYTAFGRKLAIENGYFTFNGPIGNPGLNILAMRRKQEVEAGVQVSGTLQLPNAKLVSEPNVPDNEKLSWLLFGHGTDQGNNLGQQSTATAALALLGNAGGKRLAQTVGLDEFSVGQSEVGLIDPQVVMISKAINERFVLGYEQGLQSAASVVKGTVNLSRFWGVTLYSGALNGIDLLFNRRLDGFWNK
jgi:translocation and assembly module TamB